MKVKVLNVFNDMLSVHMAAKGHNIVRKTLGRNVDKFHQTEYNEMNPNYVTASVGRSFVTKIRTILDRKRGRVASLLLHKNTRNSMKMDSVSNGILY